MTILEQMNWKILKQTRVSIENSRDSSMPSTEDSEKYLVICVLSGKGYEINSNSNEPRLYAGEPKLQHIALNAAAKLEKEDDGESEIEQEEEKVKEVDEKKGIEHSEESFGAATQERKQYFLIPIPVKTRNFPLNWESITQTW